jgi:hypothetical protein
MKPRDFAAYADYCHAQNYEYGKSWNSYKNLCERLGFRADHVRSKVIAIVKKLTGSGLLDKKTRKIFVGKFRNRAQIFVKNLYAVAGFAREILRKIWKFGAFRRKNRPAVLHRPLPQFEFFTSPKPHYNHVCDPPGGFPF